MKYFILTVVLMASGVYADSMMTEEEFLARAMCISRCECTTPLGKTGELYKTTGQDKQEAKNKAVKMCNQHSADVGYPCEIESSNCN